MFIERTLIKGFFLIYGHKKPLKRFSDRISGQGTPGSSHGVNEIAPRNGK